MDDVIKFLNLFTAFLLILDLFLSEVVQELQSIVLADQGSIAACSGNRLPLNFVQQMWL